MLYAFRILEPINNDTDPSKLEILCIFLSDPFHSHLLWTMKVCTVQIMIGCQLRSLQHLPCLGLISSHQLDNPYRQEDKYYTPVQNCTGSPWDTRGKLAQNQVEFQTCEMVLKCAQGDVQWRRLLVTNSRPVMVGFNCQRHNLHTERGISMRGCLDQAGFQAFL